MILSGQPRVNRFQVIESFHKSKITFIYSPVRSINIDANCETFDDSLASTEGLGFSAVSSRNFVPLERYGHPNKCPQITQTNKKDVVVKFAFYSLSLVGYARSFVSSYFTGKKHGDDFFVSMKDLSILPHGPLFSTYAEEF